MELFRRFSSGLFSPRSIGAYINDRKLLTFLYFIILLFISILPQTIEISRMNRIPYQSQQEIREFFKTKEEIPFKVENNKLVSLQSDVKIKSYLLSNQILVVFSLEENINVGMRNAIVFGQNGVYFQVSTFRQTLFLYSEYQEFESLDFRNAKINNDVFWNDIFKVANIEYQKVLTYIKPGLILGLLILNSISILFFSLLLALFQRSTLPTYRFSQVWKLAIYCSVPYVFGVVLSELFNFSLFSLLGLILMIIYGVISSQSLIKE
ncbi:MAG: DUF1189 family protein [Acholeplasmataceae bacterium]|mgnify:CR=1 FL=1|nr:DUF1189 family protein [Acholeplasmataceae bacterium]HQD92281.1 DUF1189 family protein [Bacilli bacterium]